MRTLTVSALAASALFAVGLMLTSPASAAAPAQVAGRSQSLLVADAEGAGADVRANARWVAMTAPEQEQMLAGRSRSLLVADAEGAGVDVRANGRWVA